jgi:hypothetical protein
MASINNISISGAVAVGSGSAVSTAMGSTAPTNSSASTAQTAASSASAGDYQAALNTFGNLVKSSFQGKKFGPEDLGRLKDAVQERLNDPNVSQGEKVALQKIYDEFKASNTDQDSAAFGAPDWATFLGNIGNILKSVPGAEKIGNALTNLSGMIADSNRKGDSTFDRNDIGSLGRRSAVWGDVGRSDVPDLAQRLIKGGRPEDGGNVINAANFGSLLSGLSLGTPAAPGAVATAAPAGNVVAAPQSSAPTASATLGQSESNLFNLAVDNFNITFNNVGNLPPDWSTRFTPATLDMTAAWTSEQKAAN